MAGCLKTALTEKTGVIKSTQHIFQLKEPSKEGSYFLKYVNMSQNFLIDGHSLTIEDVNQVAYNKNSKIQIAQTALERIKQSRQIVEDAVAQDKVIYGLTTGFGEFKNVVIDHSQTKELQDNLIMSHSIGVGEPFSESIVRAATLIRANSLSNGNSGVRLSTIEALLDIINHNLYPFVPSRGSVGASGDLAPLSHLVLARMGLGEFIVDHKRVPAAEVLKEKNLQPLILTSKEGLALNNGTAFMSAIACLNIVKTEQLIKLSDITAAMSLEAAMGTLSASDPKIHKARPHQGLIKTADNLLRLSGGSEIMESHRNCGRVQDSYSLRCTPQVHGAIKDTFNHVKSVIATEINSTTDNPLIFPETGQVISGGNFHGEPIAFVMDFLAIAVSEIGNLSDRRIFKLLTSHTNEGLPSFLIPKEKAGLSSGFMISQYTTAALTAENKVLAHPASVDSIPTSADQEDHVSFGMTAALKAKKVVENVEHIVAIELMCATQALDFKQPLLPGRGTRIARDIVRAQIPFLETDRILYKDLEKVEKTTREVVNKTEEAIGKILV